MVGGKTDPPYNNGCLFTTKLFNNTRFRNNNNNNKTHL